MKFSKNIWFYTIPFILFISGTALAQVGPYIESVAQAEKGMTLWELLKSGGVVMVVIGLISIVTLTFIIYFFMALKPSVLVPLDFSRDVISKLGTKKYAVVRDLCSQNDNIISRSVMAGMARADKGVAAVKESIEITAKTEVSKLWENISYLADLAAVSPLVGLLGTVLGMIQAFNTIAFQSAGVKPMLLAGGVSKAMITTAGGLTVAIPAMFFYAFFRSRLMRVTSAVETLTTEIVDTISDSERRK